MKTATEALEHVQAVAESIRNDETAVVGTVSRGDVIRQGDLYVVCITGTKVGDCKPTKRRQLAPGTSQGSRHVLKGACHVYEPGDSGKAEVMAAIITAVKPRTVELHDELIGPVFETVGEVELDHPEHGNRVLPAGETFAVVYQRAFAEEEARVRRQQD